MSVPFQYFLLRSGEDGTSITPLSDVQIEKLLADLATGTESYTFLDHIPDNDKGCLMTKADNSAVIIRGQIIVPKAVEVVTRYEL